MEGIAWMSHASDRASDFADAVGQHYPGLVRRLTAVVRDPDAALDLAQETYLRAYRAWNQFDGTDVRAWLYTIGLRLAFNERKRRLRWSRLFRSSAIRPAFAQPPDLDLHEALGELRPEHRAALLLNAADGYTQAEIAAMLGVPAGTVASWLSRAKQQLRRALTDE